MNTTIKTVMLLAGVSAIAACSKEPPEQLPPAPPELSRPTPPTPPTPTSPTPSSRTPGIPTQPAGPALGTQSHFQNALGSSAIIYFETDRFNIDSGDAAALQAQAQYFMRYPGLTFTIEGHADERGTREYNLALGERRANSAKNYLVSLGVDPSRISTVSYGKERPVALASDEEAWAQNRRAASILID